MLTTPGFLFIEEKVKGDMDSYVSNTHTVGFVCLLDADNTVTFVTRE